MNEKLEKIRKNLINNQHPSIRIKYNKNKYWTNNRRDPMRVERWLRVERKTY